MTYLGIALFGIGLTVVLVVTWSLCRAAARSTDHDDPTYP